MDIKERIQIVNLKSIQLYQRRQDLQLQGQQIQSMIAQIEREMLLLDGDLRTLETILKEAEDGK